MLASHIGKIFYQALKKPEKAKKYYLDSVRLLETLKPKTFNDQKWYQVMMKHMDEITKAAQSIEDAKRSAAEAELRRTCETELNDMEKACKEGPGAFLKLCSEKYESYAGKKVEFTEEELKTSSL